VRRLRAATVLAVVVACSCRSTDLNRPCTLLRGNPDGGAALVLLESEVRAAQGRNKDFITLGTQECDDVVCVRDSDLITDAGPGDPAQGYCSRSCLRGAVCPSYDGALDQGPSRLNCRPLLLDQQSLRGLDAGDLGSVRDPYFCARGTTPDAG
jgi:hypothetical protein